jgi:CRP-like cAMP-binding protein
MTDLEPLIAQNPFFKGFTQEHLAEVVGCAKNVVYKHGDYIFREKEPAHHFYIVRHGNVALEVFIPGRGPVTVLTIEEGEPIGWSWLVPPHKWHFDARCIGPVRVLDLDGDCLRKKSERDPIFGYQLMFRITQLMEQRLQATIMQMLDIYGSH